ncbi:2-amino-4-hydroxy-6-hydroxymethyldihydropteridine diphosphokinase [Bacillus sp. 31A1R]|uniref:2-amino-4-hydroxy-6-hydroxymethyldihydropteridine diphosphokinase n=1 Tax=Robertmurraya mangrovi TaxID=3098077 RepID=A0ABU5J4P3_9BACI|nr:2-amino-4-hydroxy-6-hydroxymethyldihydropteridine diphosphokinase [Bacillus sp. 31A1R]MDZ5474301.1 2-amino-4-hydroxy-6-hydroxymethyldihydropteridine diphosphokinase [Bacillus sp. 31A1R]
MNNTAYISLGTNMGEKSLNLHDAIEYIEENGKIGLVNFSSIYATDPVGYTEQDEFLNMVLHIETELNPLELLDFCLDVENTLGRKREKRWGPRIIDLDILLYNQENINSEKLIVPHPRMKDRAFVIVPLIEISPNITFPEMNQPIKSFLEDIPDKEGVRIWKLKNGEDVFALFAN